MHNIPKNSVTKFAHAQRSFALSVDKRARFSGFRNYFDFASLIERGERGLKSRSSEVSLVHFTTTSVDELRFDDGLAIQVDCDNNLPR
jgi:hypothetical protein